MNPEDIKIGYVYRATGIPYIADHLIQVTEITSNFISYKYTESLLDSECDCDHLTNYDRRPLDFLRHIKENVLISNLIKLNSFNRFSHLEDS